MGRRGKNPLFKPAGPQRTRIDTVRGIEVPLLGPPVRRVESYPLADFLYDRAKARHELQLSNLRWQKFKESLTGYERDQVERVERLFRKKVRDLA